MRSRQYSSKPTTLHSPLQFHSIMSDISIYGTTSPIHPPTPEWLNQLSSVQKSNFSSPISPISTTRRRRSSTKRIPRESVHPERARHLERNRVAADKCRTKKKEDQLKMTQMMEKQSERHEALLSEIHCLRNEIWQLKNDIFAHAECGDGEILRQLQRMAQGIVFGNSRFSSFSSTSSTKIMESLPDISIEGLESSERSGECPFEDAVFSELIAL